MQYLINAYKQVLEITITSSEKQYITKFPKAKALYEKAGAISRGGCPRDAWYILPSPIHIKEAKGLREWDVDGYEYIDYFGRHGGLILGHAHPSVVEAINRQIKRGTQYGAYSRLAIE